MKLADPAHRSGLAMYVEPPEFDRPPPMTQE
jgi:hypothetical protein